MREHWGTLDLSDFERLMTDSNLTAWAMGAAAATQQVERQGVQFADTFAETFGTEPLSPTDAIAFLAQRTPLPLIRLETILEEIQTRSFEVTRDLLETVSSRIDERLAQAVESGESMEVFLKSLDGVAEAAGLTASNPYYWETVFRTNAATAYSAGREELFLNPAVKDAFGYFQYLTVEDSAVRPEHAAMHGRVWANDDPAVKEWWPPNGYNCRCVMVPMDQEDLDDEDLKASTGSPKLDGETVTPDKGFNGLPSKRFGISPPQGQGAEVLN